MRAKYMSTEASTTRTHARAEIASLGLMTSPDYVDTSAKCLYGSFIFHVSSCRTASAPCTLTLAL